MAGPKKYPDELIQGGVRLALEGERPIAQIAADLGIHPETLRKAGAPGRGRQRCAT
jgi:transposase